MSAQDMLKDLAAEAERAQAREAELLARVAELEAANASQDKLLVRAKKVMDTYARKLQEAEGDVAIMRLERDCWKRAAQSVSPN